MLGGRTMTDQEEQSLKEAKRKEKRLEEEAEQLAREQVRKKDKIAVSLLDFYLAYRTALECNCNSAKIRWRT
jgi:hypothetical protein